MARTKISEFSATPGNNTDIDGINIAEGCAPSGINDAIRELMSQLKDFQAGTAGDSFNGPVGTTTAAAGAFTTLSASSTVSGAGFSTYLASPPAIGGTAAAAGSFTTLSASSTVTLSGGTANGVLYLNGSKVATSGSALTFDGTNLSTTGRLNTGANIGVLLNNATGAEILWQYNGTAIGEAGSANQILSGGSSTDFAFTSRGASSSLVFGVNTYEQMRLTSTGLGIGTTTINNKLEVGGVIAVQRSTNTAKVSTLSNESGNFVITADSTYNMIFNTGGGEKMRLDSSGNLGLGVTPSAWTFKAFEMGYAGNAIWGSSVNDFRMSTNVNYDGGYKYTNTGTATMYTQGSGSHFWFTAASGTAGNAISFTQAMTLFASGGLSLGNTSDPGAGNVNVSGNISLVTNGTSFQWTNSGNNVAINGASGVLAFYTGTSAYNERARIDSSGNFGLGITPNGSWKFEASNGSSDVQGRFVKSGTDSYAWGVDSSGSWSGAGGSLSFRTGGFTSASERARIDSSGNLLVGKTVTTYTTNGVSLSSNGSNFSYTSGAVLAINRNGTDGNADEFYKAGTLVGSISVTASATAYNTSSDYRLKDNPQPLTGSGAFIDALQPKTWNWKSDGSKGVGFIAHEVQEVSPSSVVGEKDGEQMQAMEYGSAEFIANIIAELQSLRKRVAQLEKGN